MQRVCIIGSLKFYKRMLDISSMLARNGTPFSIPMPGKYRDPKYPGKYISTYPSVPFAEKLKEEGRRVFAYLERVKRSDLIYLVNPGGYVGLNTAVEISCAFENKKPIYALDMIREAASLFLMKFINGLISPEELVDLSLQQQELQLVAV